jgi:hypothetical protein
MLKIAHVINVTEINEQKRASYLHIAQPLTIKSMLIAKQVSLSLVDVELVAVRHQDENIEVPAGFSRAADIDKYAWEYIDILKKCIPKKPLPRLTDILQSLYNSSDAEYFIYTNLDIGIRPHFYTYIKQMIEKGYDAFCINRRDLPKKNNGVLLDSSKTGLIYTLEGDRHPGIDCFVFKRRIFPHLNLGHVYVGFPPVGQVLKTQVEINSKSFTWIKDEFLTFHIGHDSPWLNSENSAYFDENERQASGLYENCF